MKKVLILGASSFVANGIMRKLEENNYYINCFSRGEEERNVNTIKGDYLTIANNLFLDDNYDIVINYAVMKDGTVDSNLQYINSLILLCRNKGVKKLIHFSSVMAYGYHVGKIDENTPIETLEETWKKGYGEFKIAVDQYLMSIRETSPFEVIIVRPGYVLADNRPCPFIKPLPLGFALIKGDSKSKQPIVKREDIHKAILKIIDTENNLPVYHFFPNDGMTKYRFAKQNGYNHLIPMPRIVFKYIPWIMMKVGIMPKAMYSRFDGMYNECDFSSEMTEKKLKIKFT